MERPAQPPPELLGLLPPPPPVVSGATIPTPSDGALPPSTIYASTTDPSSYLQQPRHSQPLHHPQQSLARLDTAIVPPPLRRAPKRAARWDPGAPEEPPELWGNTNGSPAKTNSADRNGNGPSPGLGTSPGTDDQDSNAASPGQPRKKKQKRNKPTLSCHECVERKTKCDRGRPHCLACIKRQTKCEYGHVAILLEENILSGTNGRLMTNPPRPRPANARRTMPNVADRGLNVGRFKETGSVATSTGLLSNVPYSTPGSSNVFGIGSEHPFANYWTCDGGLPEVVGILPSKDQADVLLARYFECVDPVYPMLHRQTFYAAYEHFCSLDVPEKDRSDAAFVALLLIMLALGMQFTGMSGRTERKRTAEFYASASNQALRMCSYLSVASIKTIQTMVLMTYFLINDDHASDGWAFAGVLVRQAYAMGIHRNPDIVVPDASPFEKQQRRKVWQAVLLQDTFLTVLLSLPPNATHTDVSVDDLVEDSASIASDNPADTAYIRGSWTLANLVQRSICSPRCLDVPICATARQKSKLVADFKAVYRSFPDAYRSWDADSLAALAQINKRVVLQTLFLSSNYHHNLMLVHASESPEVAVNVRGTLEAAHEAIKAFFVLFSLFEGEARVWWVFNHRAFLEALCIGNVLKELAQGQGHEALTRDPLYDKARGDIHRMIQIMQAMSDGPQASETARTRVQVLSELLL